MTQINDFTTKRVKSPSEKPIQIIIKQANQVIKRYVLAKLKGNKT